MKTQILELIQNHPRHYAKMIKNQPELYSWIKQHTLVPESDSWAEQIYSAISQENVSCANNSLKKFKSIAEGYGFCGMTKTCVCAQQTIGKKVSEKKQSYTDDERLAIHNKRSDTNLQKYGVANVGQTQLAKSRHQEFYNSDENVAKIIAQIQQTCLNRYGVYNPAHLESSKQKTQDTLQARYNVNNISQIPTVKDKLRARIQIQKEEGIFRNAGYLKFSNFVISRYNAKLITPIEQYLTDKINLDFECLKCQHQFTKRFYYGLGVVCYKCNPKIPAYVSREEQAVYDFITTQLGITNSHQGDRSLISPLELDMVFPDQKIAVEYCGLYYHSEDSHGKDAKYHSNKMNMTNAAGYRLLTIFSDEWLRTPEIVKSKLRNIFGKTDKIHARKCRVEIISHHDAKQFMEQYHLQGHSTHTMAIGLRDQHSTLLSVMTFSTGRVALNTEYSPGEYELVRYATNGTTIVGGASKLLKFFERTCQPVKITSYADLRWSQGNVYEVLGFTLTGIPTVGYWYVENYSTRIHRYNFRKSTLAAEGADAQLTEWQIMKSLGYDRIWDCGHAKYIKQY